MLALPAHYSDASVQELTTFLSGTHRRLGWNSLPYKLASRAPELLRVIAAFVLTRCSRHYTGGMDGRVDVVEFVFQGKPSLNVRSIFPTHETESLPLVPGSSGSSSRVHAVAVNHSWLVTAESNGTVRAFSFPSLCEAHSLNLGTSLPPQTMSLAGDSVIVASKRVLFVVDILKRAIVHELTLPFSERPTIICDDACIFAQCDEAICLWSLDSSPDAFSRNICLRSQDPEVLQNPHRQMVVGMILPPQLGILITASLVQVRGWQRPTSDARGFELLWTLEMCDNSFGNSILRVMSLAYVCHGKSSGQLLVFGDTWGMLAMRTLDFSASGVVAPSKSTDVRVGPFPATVPFVSQVDAAHVILWLRDTGWLSYKASSERVLSSVHCMADSSSPTYIASLAPAAQPMSSR
eukprot:TRINITY_DN7154_c1_g2_i1.p1 TRINITY_DN7154_c1_g2~~TRINITY_DN7154_c1_g2_i1.p1  ORF type:complete len:407 (+),score=1.54 TRINITY_DN7154_c1_g2_i1:153-1373(+)